MIQGCLKNSVKGGCVGNKNHAPKALKGLVAQAWLKKFEISPMNEA